jgi:hypothetical protein
MKPGLTGWAQVNGRRALSFSKRLEHDVWYVDNFSLGLDATILARTVREVLRGTGVITGQRLDDIDDLGLAPDLDRPLLPAARESARLAAPGRAVPGTLPAPTPPK